MQTSTVTVVAYEEAEDRDFSIPDKDILMFTTKDTGPGGQHRNKTESCVIMRHLPTGIESKAASRSQWQNKKTARDMLEARVQEHYARLNQQQHSQMKKEKRGNGMRGDKIRTYRKQDGVVINHLDDTKHKLSNILKGALPA